MADIKSELRLAKEAIKKKEHKEALKHCRVSYYFQFFEMLLVQSYLISIVNLIPIGKNLFEVHKHSYRQIYIHCNVVV